MTTPGTPSAANPGKQEWTLSGKMLVAPGTYTIRVVANDGALDSNESLTMITVTQENAAATYTGPSLTWAATTSSTTATIRFAPRSVTSLRRWAILCTTPTRVKS